MPSAASFGGGRTGQMSFRIKISGVTGLRQADAKDPDPAG